jgi:hypothetical protein
MPPLDETVVSLENKMIIYKASNSGQSTIRGLFWPYAINSIAWENLTMAKLGLNESPTQKEETDAYYERPEWTRGDLI